MHYFCAALWQYQVSDYWSPWTEFSCLMCNCRRNWSWRLWTIPTVNQKHTSTPTCAALWFWSVSRWWWVLFIFYLFTLFKSAILRACRGLKIDWVGFKFRHVLRGPINYRWEYGCVSFPQILVIIGLTHALVVFRVIAAVLLAEGSWEFLRTHSNTGAMMLGAVVHYLIITIMTRVRRPPNCACLLSASSVLRISHAVFIFAGQQDRCHEAVWNRYVYCSHCKHFNGRDGSALITIEDAITLRC